MESKYFTIILLVFLLILPSNAICGANNGFGFIVDSKGIAFIKRGGSTIKAEFGQEIAVGDILHTGNEKNLVIVGYKNCDEYIIPPLTQVQVIKVDEVVTEAGNFLHSRRVPACYKPESYAADSIDNNNGTVLRGPSWTMIDQDMEKIRQSAQSGKSSNSELMALIVYNINKGNHIQAKKYYSQLLSENPKAIMLPSLIEQLR